MIFPFALSNAVRSNCFQGETENEGMGTENEGMGTIFVRAIHKKSRHVETVPPIN